MELASSFIFIFVAGLSESLPSGFSLDPYYRYKFFCFRNSHACLDTLFFYPYGYNFYTVYYSRWLVGKRHLLLGYQKRIAAHSSSTGTHCFGTGVLCISAFWVISLVFNFILWWSWRVFYEGQDLFLAFKEYFLG